MRIAITSKNIDIGARLKERIEKKAAKLDKFLAEEEEVQIRLSQERQRNTAEITIALNGVLLRAEETGEDLMACMDKVMDKIVRQIRRHRTKLEKRLREGVYEREEPDFEQPDEATLVRTKRFAMKPMSVDDAIAQMDMLEHSFFMFINDETSKTCVVYKRQDGNYGLLEPDNA